LTRLIRFRTNNFDISSERSNPINPIPGESLLLWLADRAKPRTSVSPPAPEDWGWYSTVEWGGRCYMLGSSASPEDGGESEWVLQVVKTRTLQEKIFGREHMAADDACANFFQDLLENELGFGGVTADP
jgi:hypothetical protein